MSVVAARGDSVGVELTMSGVSATARKVEEYIVDGEVGGVVKEEQRRGATSYTTR